MSDLWKIEEPMPAPQPVRLGDKPAREMTVRERFVMAAMQGLFADPACENIDEGLMIQTVDRVLSALEGSAGK